MNTNSQEFLSAAQKIFQRHFKEYASPAGIAESIRLPQDDPGQWARTSILVIYTEGGIPDRFYYSEWSGAWDKVEDELSVLLGRDVFFESINAAVSALYWV